MKLDLLQTIRGVMELGFYLLAIAVLVMGYVIHIMWKNVELLDEKNNALSTVLAQLLQDEIEEGKILVLTEEKENE